MKKKIVYNNAKKLYSILLSTYYNDDNEITDEEIENMGKKYSPNNLFIYNHLLLMKLMMILMNLVIFQICHY